MKTKGSECAIEKRNEVQAFVDGNRLITKELHYPDRIFEIVEKAPRGYVIWNIGHHMPAGYIPYVRVGGHDGCQVDTETMKALRI